MRLAILPLLVALVVSACAPSRSGPTSLGPVSKHVTLAELVANGAQYGSQRVTFSATVERVEETTQGSYLHLRDGEQQLVAYVPASFGGALRDSVGEGVTQFEVEVGEKKLTPLGTMALQMMPYQMVKTRYFDEAVPIEPPGP